MNIAPIGNNRNPGFDDSTILKLIKQDIIANILPGAIHELNNHLTSITGYTDLMIADPGGGEQRVSDLQTVKASAEKCSKLIGVLGRLSNGTHESASATFEPAKEIRDAVLLLKKACRERNVRIRFNTPESIPEASGDGNEFMLVFVALLHEMLGKMPRGAEISIELSCGPRADTIEIGLRSRNVGEMEMFGQESRSGARNVFGGEITRDFRNRVLAGMDGAFSYTRNPGGNFDYAVMLSAAGDKHDETAIETPDRQLAIAM